MEIVYSKEDLKEMELISKVGEYFHGDLCKLLLDTYAIDIEKTTLEIMRILIEKKLPVVVVDKVISNVCVSLKASKLASTLESLTCK